ncbi:MAG: acetate kinase [Oscillospiraceae bacterium]|jgi:acetate kinase|nr:acetate kinase [Oscillospiraceae bacterium]
MKILAINTGGSSFKYQLFDMEAERTLVKGNCENVGAEGCFIAHICRDAETGNEKEIVKRGIKTCEDALKTLILLLTDREYGVVNDINEIAAIGHRVVQGADLYSDPVSIDEEVTRNIGELADLAPVHNLASASVISCCMVAFTGIPEVAVFDTAFHSTIPDYAYMFGLPYRYYEKYKIRKYGFHGISHRYVSQKYSDLLGRSLKELKIVSCHLGDGCSVTAIDGGRSVETSMGFTPLDGLLMGTRSGTLDPSVVTYLMKKEGLSSDQMEEILNKESGYLGLSGLASDSRVIVDAAIDGNELANLVLKMQSHRIKKYIGGYAAVMNGLDALLFTGGIGENSYFTRELVCADMDFFLLELDEKLNMETNSGCRRISKGGSKDIWVIPTNEEWVIAKETRNLLLGVS